MDIEWDKEKWDLVNICINGTEAEVEPYVGVQTKTKFRFQSLFVTIFMIIYPEIKSNWYQQNLYCALSIQF